MFGENAELRSENLQLRGAVLLLRATTDAFKLVAERWKAESEKACPTCTKRDQAELDKLAKRNREDEIRKIVEPIVKRELGKIAAAKARR